MTANEAERIAVEFATKQVQEAPARVGPAKKSQNDPSRWVVLIEWPRPAGIMTDGGDTLVIVDNETGAVGFCGR